MTENSLFQNEGKWGFLDPETLFSGKWGFGRLSGVGRVGGIPPSKPWEKSISPWASMTRRRGRPPPQGTSKNFGQKNSGLNFRSLFCLQSSFSAYIGDFLRWGNGRGVIPHPGERTMFVRNGAVTPGPSSECDITFFVKGRPNSA